MIDRDKLSPEDRQALDDRAVLVRNLFDEANLAVQDLHISPDALPIVALMMLMIGNRATRDTTEQTRSGYGPPTR